MHDYYIMIAIGVVLVAASVSAKGFSYGMAPHRVKPVYPATRRLRLVLLSFGLLFLAFWLVGLLRQ